MLASEIATSPAVGAAPAAAVRVTSAPSVSLTTATLPIAAPPGSATTSAKEAVRAVALAVAEADRRREATLREHARPRRPRRAACRRRCPARRRPHRAAAARTRSSRTCPSALIVPLISTPRLPGRRHDDVGLGGDLAGLPAAAATAAADRRHARADARDLLVALEGRRPAALPVAVAAVAHQRPHVARVGEAEAVLVGAREAMVDAPDLVVVGADRAQAGTRVAADRDERGVAGRVLRGRPRRSGRSCCRPTTGSRRWFAERVVDGVVHAERVAELVHDRVAGVAGRRRPREVVGERGGGVARECRWPCR